MEEHQDAAIPAAAAPRNRPFPWPAGTATGVGSLPGADPDEAMRVITGELPDLPHLAELPARGPGAGLAGRAAALLVDLPAEITPNGWRFASRPGRDLIRARSMLSADLDALEEAASGYHGPLKIQVCGPWTLAASIELARSQDPALADPGAAAELTASLAEGVAAHVAEVRSRVPGADVLLQLDEPSLPAVLAGSIRTASGLHRVTAPEPADAEDRLRAVISAAPAFSIVHCCARPVPFGIIAGAGAGAAGIDLSLLRQAEEDALAEVVEAGLGIMAGVVPALPAGPTGGAGAPQQAAGPRAAARQDAGRPGQGQLPSARAAAGRVTGLWQRLGWPAAGAGNGAAGRESPGGRSGPVGRESPGGRSGPVGRESPGGRSGPVGRQSTAGQVVLAPACGLAGASPGYARAALARCREAARLLPELIEEGTG